MKVQMEKAQEGSMFDVPAGMYTAELEGIKEFPPSEQHPDWGPSLCWEFRVTAGPHQGKKASRFTGCKATTANTLGKFLAQLNGGPIDPGIEVDLAVYVGRKYRINVAPKPKNPEKTQVDSLFPLDTPPAAPAAPRPPAPAAQTPPPPPGDAAEDDTQPMYWVVMDGATVQKTYDEISAYMHTHQLDPQTFRAMRVDSPPGTQWSTAHVLGIVPGIPF